MRVALFLLLVAALLIHGPTTATLRAQEGGSAAASSLDYEFFKTKVQPIFLTKRDGHARCVACHTVNNAPFKLVALSPGAPTWNEEQSRMNFELVKRVAMPGFLESKLLIHPLAEEAG